MGVFNYKDIYCKMRDLIRHILIEEIKVKNFIQEAKQKKIVCGDINDEIIVPGIFKLIFLGSY